MVQERCRKRHRGSLDARASLPRAIARECSAQGTLEYAVTTVALLAMVCALALLWRAGATGTLVGLAEDAASHVLDGLGVLDVALY